MDEADTYYGEISAIKMFILLEQGDIWVIRKLEDDVTLILDFTNGQHNNRNKCRVSTFDVIFQLLCGNAWSGTYQWTKIDHGVTGCIKDNEGVCWGQ